ncbi:D-alanyl-D-alanine carboxypeptidase/D-alanyl-D-alanine-endopeptidase [Accumulibacter sp.]|uniref:D-alanyl-D-alanine carboxypeptidase/D-alanyl-D-alanine endopeptidase n=1 Tax=Accumulibacter sp. TaxID=2053492 RepID=UPI0025CD0B57|nr:D-alanyl-D-alanine carboxypeptidase/D-alanyl-D-alanine-endopeptidase [Accumulibacter sp.]MCM8595449.1 D-alanyl-D-alanine carboxypeptidase/D-alanyl-D-alanine-endopeptidase [Accumulibacter sp.]MCM8626370.1 D-alanyl-D-alanine carboxypeptidase/D-alanyl-D-alanine-endopeptidase [Accumulibacter sp.]MDS4049596.1 D-alanyl-D-alanine carboxypeptidase/D-alanyl-D-alanine-endopeptidase [Accumulibacter sp.]
MSRALADAGIPTRSVSIVVQNVEGGPPLLSHNPRQAMNPASVMKLVTTYAALDILGPAYTWRTEVYADGRPAGGRLAGNLYLRGSGDPRLDLEKFWQLLRQVRSRGVSEIGGDLVLDRSAFALPQHDPGEFDNEPLRPYNAGPDALLINFRSISLTLLPDPIRQTVEVLASTPAEGLRIDNRLVAGREACGDWREQIRPSVSGRTIQLAGSLAAACGEKVLHLAPWPADVQVDSLFRALWRELGGAFAGQVREGRVPPEAQLLAAQDSPALGEIVRDINKHSNNVMARQLFLSLDGQRPATPDGARRQIAAWSQAKGLNLPELVLDNGSGLSRSERISADGLAQLLRAAWRSPVMPELIASLPLAGVDGTLRKRLNEGGANGRAHLKTGYLEGVRSIAGYLLDQRGRRWIAVFLINDPKARLGKPAIDALLLWLAQH